MALLHNKHASIFKHSCQQYGLIHMKIGCKYISPNLSSILNRCQFETRHFCSNLGFSNLFRLKFFSTSLNSKLQHISKISEIDDRFLYCSWKTCYGSSNFQPNCGDNYGTHFSKLNEKILLNRTLYKCKLEKSRPISYTSKLGKENSVNVKVSDINNLGNGNLVNAETIEKVIKEFGKKSYEQGYTCFITTCPKLCKKHLSMVDDKDRLYINSTTGHFICNHCKKSGPWTAFEDNSKAIALKKTRKSSYNCLANLPDIHDLGEEPKQAKELYDKGTQIIKLDATEFEELCNTFNCNGLQKTVMTGYGVKFVKETNSLLFPYYNPDKKLLAVKQIMAVVSEDENITLKQKFVPRTGMWHLFGWKKVQQSKTSVILASNEFDALAVSQSTGQNVLSLPKGYMMLPQEVLPYLEIFDKIVFWLGTDARSWDAAKLFALKVNKTRSHVIRPSSDDFSPLQTLQNGIRLTKILDKARPYVHQSIVSFTNLKEEVFSDLSMMEQVSGVKWKRYTAFNKLLKGHRRGELTVFTGPTGAGKTTFMSEYSLDLCMQGVSTLWGSFEIQNVRLARVMLMQYALKNLHNHLDEFDYWSEQFDQLPMHFMTFFGQEDIAQVIEVMSHAVYVHDIGHIVVDNLQFMMGMDFSVSDRFLKQDRVVAAFRRFATQKNCHVTLIIHPRKEKSDEDLTIASVFGTAKVTQEADNIMILQDKTLTTARGRKFIQVVKNRYSGDRGLVQLKFHSDSLTFSGVAEPKEKASKEKGKTTIALNKNGKDNEIIDGSESVADVKNVAYGESVAVNENVASSKSVADDKSSSR